MLKRWLAFAMLVCVACTQAEAGPRGHLRRGGARLAAGDAGTPDSGAGVLDRHTWSWSYAGSGCPPYTSGYPVQVGGADGGSIMWGYGSDGGSYACNTPTSWDGGALTTAGLGAEYIDRAYGANNGAPNCFGIIPPAVSFPAIADGEDIWCRAILRTGDNAANTYLWSQGTASTNVFSIYLGSTERLTFSFRTGGLTALVGTSPVLPQTSQSLVDFYYHGAAPTNPSLDTYGNGTASIGSEHTANLGAMSAGLNLGVGGIGYQNCNPGAVTGIFDLVWIGCAYGPLAAGFTGAAMHTAECQELGICP